MILCALGRPHAACPLVLGSFIRMGGLPLAMRAVTRRKQLGRKVLANMFPTMSKGVHKLSDGSPCFNFGVNTSKLACVHALCLPARSHSWRAQPCACFHELTRGSPLGHGAPIQCCLRKQIQMMFERYLGSVLLILWKLRG